MEQRNHGLVYIEMDYKEIRQNIRQKILQTDSSIGKVERLSNINENVLRFFLKGVTKSIDLEVIFKLAKFFDCHYTGFIEGFDADNTGKNKAVKKISRETVSLKSHLLKETCDYVLEYINSHHLNVSSAEVFLFIEKIYYFSWKKTEFDKEFADWYIDEYFSKK